MSAGSPPRILPDSRLQFEGLSIVAQGDDFLVGDPRSGTFLAVPEIGISAIRILQTGVSVSEAAEAVSRDAGQDVDVLDFANVLAEAGFISRVDGVSVRPDVPAAADRRLVSARLRSALQVLASVPAAVFYAGAALGSLVIFVLRPDLVPGFEDFYFYPNPAVCVVVMTLISVVLTAGHEGAHWMAAQAVGVGARFRISHRAYFPVFETDVSGLWSVPRHKRFATFVAGMTFDAMVLSAALLLEVAWIAGLLAIPDVVIRLMRALVLVTAVTIGFQTLVFLRTDLYAVLVTALGCFNLSGVTRLFLLSRLRSLTAAEQDELAAAHPHDVRVARWFSLLCLVGVAWLVYFFLVFFLPSTAVMAGWLVLSLFAAPPTSAGFLQALPIALLALVRLLWPVAVIVRSRMSLPRTRATA